MPTTTALTTAPTTPAATPAARPVITVSPRLTPATRTETFLGAVHYADGGYLVLTATPSPLDGTGARDAFAQARDGARVHGYRLRPAGLVWGEGVWQEVRQVPFRLVEFVTTWPLGATARIEHRRIEIVGILAAVPTGRVDVTHPTVTDW